MKLSTILSNLNRDVKGQGVAGAMQDVGEFLKGLEDLVMQAQEEEYYTVRLEMVMKARGLNITDELAALDRPELRKIS